MPFTVSAGQQYLDAGHWPGAGRSGDDCGHGVARCEPERGAESGRGGAAGGDGRSAESGGGDPGDGRRRTVRGTTRFTVPAGTYLVQVSDTHDVLDDYTVGPLGPTPGADNNSQGQPYLVTVAGWWDERDG